MRPRRTAIVVIVLCILIAGCGTKGPLYMPGVPVTAPWPYTKPVAAQQTPEKKPADVPATTEDKQ
jgi:predicted small lipoprotein YifL